MTAEVVVGALISRSSSVSAPAGRQHEVTLCPDPGPAPFPTSPATGSAATLPHSRYCRRGRAGVPPSGVSAHGTARCGPGAGPAGVARAAGAANGNDLGEGEGEGEGELEIV